MGGSKKKTESKRKSKPRGASSREEPRKLNAKMIALATIILMLFVSYVVIFSNPETDDTKNMVFSQDNSDPNIHHGNVENIDIELSKASMKIKDIRTSATNTTDVLFDGIVVNTRGDLNCTFFDRNANDRLDSQDEFLVYNAAAGDWIQITMKTTGAQLAFYEFR